MKICIIFGHHNTKDSFNAHIRDTFIQEAERCGHEIDLVNLFEEKEQLPFYNSTINPPPKLANSIMDIAIKNETSTKEELCSLQFTNGKSIEDNILEQTGIIGEKLELKLKSINAEYVSCYVHAGSRLASMVGFDKQVNENIAKDVAMQIAAMNPIAIDKDSVSEETINKEIEIGKDLAKQEGKPENMLDKIAIGRLNKFFKENTLLSQAFIKDSKMSVSNYIASNTDNAKVLSFERVGLS